MTNTFSTGTTTHLMLPGLPADYLDTAVLDIENRALLSEREVMVQILQDQIPLPTSDAREGYFGPRHIEYWLSGLRDMRKAVQATGQAQADNLRVLDFGGASGRVIRHFANSPRVAEVFNCDINPQHILLTKQLFGSRVRAIRNRGLPTLPLADGYLDLITAFSVFTHIDSEDVAWLLELRRVVKPGGYIYLTIHDQATWDILPRTVICDLSFSNDDFRIYYEENPILGERVVHTYNNLSDYQCNVFVNHEYIQKHWAPLFSEYRTFTLAHDHQSAIAFRV